MDLAEMLASVKEEGIKEGREIAIREFMLKDCESCKLKLTQQSRQDTIDECISKIDTLEQISFGIVETELVKSLLKELKEQTNK